MVADRWFRNQRRQTGQVQRRSLRFARDNRESILTRVTERLALFEVRAFQEETGGGRYDVLISVCG